MGFLVAVVSFFFSFQCIVSVYEINRNSFLFSILIRIGIWGLFPFEGYCKHDSEYSQTLGKLSHQFLLHTYLGLEVLEIDIHTSNPNQ